MKKLPIVAVIGRANVGKSSLINAVLGERQAVVAREAGTTRDAIYSKVEAEKHHFWLIDTAGLKSPEDDFEASIQEQIIEATEAADAIVMVVDSTTVITEEDRQVAKKAHKTGKPTILVINKIDIAKKPDISQFERLGFKIMVTTSASQRRGIGELLEAITGQIKPITAPKTDEILRIALVGRPNVGKSHLFNTLGKKQQAIVAEVAGTTRDVNRLRIRVHNREVELMDTAGIRRSGKIEVGIERFSVLRTIAAIDEADVVLLLMDGNELNTKLDQKVAGIVKEAGKGLVLVVSKWDSVDKDAYTRDDLAKSITQNFPYVPWASLIFTSAKTGQNVTKLFEIALEIDAERKRKIKTTELNRWLERAVAKHPPAGFGRFHPKLKYIVQTGTEPPTFTIHGTNLSELHWSYKRYLDRGVRETFGFSGTPVVIAFADAK